MSASRFPSQPTVPSSLRTPMLSSPELLRNNNNNDRSRSPSPSSSPMLFEEKDREKQMRREMLQLHWLYASAQRKLNFFEDWRKRVLKFFDKEGGSFIDSKSKRLWSSTTGDTGESEWDADTSTEKENRKKKWRDFLRELRDLNSPTNSPFNSPYSSPASSPNVGKRRRRGGKESMETGMGMDLQDRASAPESLPEGRVQEKEEEDLGQKKGEDNEGEDQTLTITQLLPSSFAPSMGGRAGEDHSPVPPFCCSSCSPFPFAFFQSPEATFALSLSGSSGCTCACTCSCPSCSSCTAPLCEACSSNNRTPSTIYSSPPIAPPTSSPRSHALVPSPSSSRSRSLSTSSSLSRSTSPSSSPSLFPSPTPSPSPPPIPSASPHRVSLSPSPNPSVSLSSVPFSSSVSPSSTSYFSFPLASSTTSLSASPNPPLSTSSTSSPSSPSTPSSTSSTASVPSTSSFLSSISSSLSALTSSAQNPSPRSPRHRSPSLPPSSSRPPSPSPPSSTPSHTSPSFSPSASAPHSPPPSLESLPSGSFSQSKPFMTKFFQKQVSTSQIREITTIQKTEKTTEITKKYTIEEVNPKTLRCIVRVQAMVRTFLTRHRLRISRKMDVAIKELIETETKYSALLGGIHNNFQRPLRNSSKPYLSEKEFNTIFAEIETIRMYSHSLLSDLSFHRTIRKTLLHPFHEFESVFCSLYHLSRSYILLASNLPQALITLCLARERGDVGQFITKQETNHQVNLVNLLLRPVDRIKEYVKMIEEIVRFTPRLHPDRPTLVRLVQKLIPISQFLEQKRAKIETTIQMIRVYVNLRPQPKDFLRLDREFVSEGDVHFYEKEGARPRPKFLFLFSDILLITRKVKSGIRSLIKSSQVSESYILEIYVPLKNITSIKVLEVPEEMESSDLMPKNCFVMDSSKKSMMIQCTAEGQHRIWVEKIQEGMAKAKGVD